MATEIMVEGAAELARALRKMGDDARRSVMAGALAPAALPVLRAAQGYAPRGATGDLARGLEIRYGQETASHADIAIGSFGRAGMAKGSEPLGAQSYQHGFVELGTAHARAHPYLRPALDATKDRVVATVTRWLRYLVAEAGPAT